MSCDDNSGSGTDSLETPRPVDDADNSPASACVSEAEWMHVENGCSLKSLALLSIGPKNDNGTATFGPSNPCAILPLSAAQRPATLKHTSKELCKEILQCCTADKAPCPSQWLVPRLVQWLVNTPIEAEDDNTFICATIVHQISVAECSILGQPDPSSTNPPEALKGSKWFGKY